MSKLVPICKKCGWKHLDWEPCRNEDGSPKEAAIKNAVSIDSREGKEFVGGDKWSQGQIAEMAPKLVVEPPKISRAELAALPEFPFPPVDRKAYLRDYARAKRKGCKWALSEILKLTDVAEIHKLAKSVLDKSS